MEECDEAEIEMLSISLSLLFVLVAAALWLASVVWEKPGLQYSVLFTILALFVLLWK